MKELPVIIVTVYDRFKHIKQCLESLEGCHGIEQFDVIIGSDAAAFKKHAESISEVRKYLKAKESSNSFKSLTCIIHDSNVSEKGNNSSVHKLAQDRGYNTFIKMEDDIIVGKHFLDFVCDGLQKYEYVEDVIAVLGYRSPDKISITKAPYLTNRFCAYGYGSWYSKWNKIRVSREKDNYAKYVLSNINLFKNLAGYSPNVKSYPFLAERDLTAGDIEYGLMMEVRGLWALIPPVSLTANRGLDGSGLRSGINPTLQNLKPSDKNFEAPAPSEVEFFTNEQTTIPITYKLFIMNWISFLIYKFVPFGYSILKAVRSLIKS